MVYVQCNISNKKTHRLYNADRDSSRNKKLYTLVSSMQFAVCVPA